MRPEDALLAHAVADGEAPAPVVRDFERRAAADPALRAARDEVESLTPDAAYERRQLCDRVQQALLAMKSDDRAVITLRHFAECSYQEIGEVLGLDDKAVKWRLHDARQRLALQLAAFKVR